MIYEINYAVFHENLSLKLCLENFSGPESYLMCVMFTLKFQILLVLKAKQ